MLFRSSDSPARYEHDIALTVRWDIASYWLFKFEAHYLRCTAALAQALNPGHPLALQTPGWAFFTAKLTAYF